MNLLIAFIAQHWLFITATAGYIGTAIVATMPAPGKPVDYYQWAYDAFHIMLNSKSAPKGAPPA